MIALAVFLAVAAVGCVDPGSSTPPDELCAELVDTDCASSPGGCVDVVCWDGRTGWCFGTAPSARSSASRLAAVQAECTAEWLDKACDDGHHDVACDVFIRR